MLMCHQADVDEGEYSTEKKLRTPQAELQIGLDILYVQFCIF